MLRSKLAILALVMPLLAQGHGLEPTIRKTRMTLCYTRFFMTATNNYEEPTRYVVEAFETDQLRIPVELTAVPKEMLIQPFSRTRFTVGLRDYEKPKLYVCTKSVFDEANTARFVSRVCSKVLVYASPNHNDPEWCASERIRREYKRAGGHSVT